MTEAEDYTYDDQEEEDTYQQEYVESIQRRLDAYQRSENDDKNRNTKNNTETLLQPDLPYLFVSTSLKASTLSSIYYSMFRTMVLRYEDPTNSIKLPKYCFAMSAAFVASISFCEHIIKYRSNMDRHQSIKEPEVYPDYAYAKSYLIPSTIIGIFAFARRAITEAILYRFAKTEEDIFHNLGGIVVPIMSWKSNIISEVLLPEFIGIVSGMESRAESKAANAFAICVSDLFILNILKYTPSSSLYLWLAPLGTLIYISMVSIDNLTLRELLPYGVDPLWNKTIQNKTHTSFWKLTWDLIKKGLKFELKY